MAVSCVRVLSDLMFRSGIFDLAVLPEYQHKRIGSELVNKCRGACPYSEWMAGTETAVGFYKKMGFNVVEMDKGIFFNIPYIEVKVVE